MNDEIFRKVADNPNDFLFHFTHHPEDVEGCEYCEFRKAEALRILGEKT